MHRILIIEDNVAARDEARRVLQTLGHEVDVVDASGAITLLAEQDFDIVVAGLEPARDVPPPVDASVRAIPQELICLPRPVSIDAVVAAVAEIATRAAIQESLEHARLALVDDARPDHAGPPIVGRSRSVRLALGRVAAVASSNAPVLLTGESGTGKDLLAQTIHAQSSRRDKPFVVVNCAAFPETLIEAELFGHERGAFTGALHKRDGRFKAADGGTLFLDEINGLSLSAQAKLLRVLQDGTFQPIGTNTEVAVDVRLISATNRELKTLVAEGAFREDLYYRVKVLDVELPALRDRIGDLVLLVAYFLRKHAPTGRRPTLSPSAWAALSVHSFPGNIRELEHAVQHAVVLARGFEIELEHLPRDISAIAGVATLGSQGDIQPLSVAVGEFEREYMLRALKLARGNKTAAARLLGMSRKHLWEKLRRLSSDVAGDLGGTKIVS